uniref:aldo/keto reductase n=1 Tax=Staphylococcus aureus TaxID=1280 RepID=UPI001BFCF942
GRYQSYDDALTAIQESIYRLGVEYLDLYLIHWPNPKQGKYVEAWQAMIAAQKAGLIKSIGVCNFLPEHIETLHQETGVLPAVNQIELHPYFN